MNEKPSLSVVTINFNNAKGLEKTMQSVLNQNYKDFDYIIIDGGSSDGSVEIIKRLLKEHPNGKMISYWVSEKDHGIYDAMNKGIAHASGDYIGLINSGDFFEPDTCDIIATEINKTGRKDVYSGILKFLNKDGEVIGAIGNTMAEFPKKMISHQCCFIKKEIYIDEKYNTRFRSAGDIDLVFRLRNKGCSFVFVEKVLGTFNGGGISSSFSGIKEGLKVKVNYKSISVWNYLFQCMCYKIKLAIF